MSYLQRHVIDARSTPQTHPVPGRSDQVQNSAGGYVFEAGDFQKMRRWLILGSEGGTFYVGERKLTTQNVNVVRRCIAEDGIQAVNLIYEVSTGGLAIKQSPTLYALAIACASKDDAVRKYALDHVISVCRTPTMLWEWLEYVKGERGVGRGIRKVLGDYYNAKTPKNAAYHAVKYRQRNNWTHRDTLRVSHAVGRTREHQDLFTWIVKGALPEQYSEDLRIIEGFERIQATTDPKIATDLIRDYDLPWEAVPSELTALPEVQAAILENMPVTAMVRNLGNYTASGLISQGSDAARLVRTRLEGEETIKRSRIHPIAVLFALKTYASGRGFRGTKTWDPVSSIVDTLDGVFYAAFGNVEPTGKRMLLAIDVSGSMDWSHISGTTITPREAAAAMALVTASVETDCEIVGFATSLMPLDISKRRRLDDVVRYMQGIPMGGTDCSAPFIWAKQTNKSFDGFVVYTDSETWAGRMHPHQALAGYRRAKGIEARSAVVGMTASPFTIADPADPGMMDFVGFDPSVPAVLSSFIKGDL